MPVTIKLSNVKDLFTCKNCLTN